MKLFYTKEGESFLYKEGDLHTRHGVIKKEAIKKARAGSSLMTNTGKAMQLTDAGFLDIFYKMKRKAQVILPKDTAAIMANTGIGKSSVVLDAGAGSGWNACFLANVVKKVYTYERREDFLKTVEGNISMLGWKNIVVKNKDIYEGIDEKKLDCIVLDLAEPWRVLEHTKKALKHGGHIACYMPNVLKVQELVKQVNAAKHLHYLKTVEVIEREWEVDEHKARPSYQMLGHTGFLSFARKL